MRSFSGLQIVKLPLFAHLILLLFSTPAPHRPIESSILLCVYQATLVLLGVNPRPELGSKASPQRAEAAKPAIRRMPIIVFIVPSLAPVPVRGRDNGCSSAGSGLFAPRGFVRPTALVDMNPDLPTVDAFPAPESLVLHSVRCCFQSHP